MKALFFLGALVIAALGGQAQGTFMFINRSPATEGDPSVYDIDGLTRLAGANYVAAIFLKGVQLVTPAPFRTGAGAGFWNPGADSTRTIIGKFPGEVVDGFTVKVWDSSRGATMEEVRSAGGKYGESRSFSITLGGPPSDPNWRPGWMHNFTGLTLVPEPAVAALGGMGALLFMIRHHKQRRLRTSVAGRPWKQLAGMATWNWRSGYRWAPARMQKTSMATRHWIWFQNPSPRWRG